MHFNAYAKNEKYVFRVNDMEIDADSIDITEDSLTDFGDRQKQKFRHFLQEWLP